ncbi:MAG: hypothetical protein WCA09_16765 [Burkholderiales bacterium]
MGANQQLREGPLPALAAKLQRYWRHTVLVVVPLALLAQIMAHGRITQDPAYHDFADQRRLLGIPHFLDVASNLPFLIVGAAGLLLCLGPRRPPRCASWATFFAGATLTFFGSTRYHLAPSDATLVWDRLPMTIAFMAFFTALVSEHVGERLERYVLVPAVALGLASVLWWYYGGDLRLYYWVQSVPLVCLPFSILMFRAMYTHRVCLVYGLALYVLAKLAEAWDLEIYSLTSGTVSGHTLKHLLAASAVLCVYLMLRLRRPAPRGTSAPRIAAAARVAAD